MKCKDDKNCLHPNLAIRNLLRFKGGSSTRPSLGYGLLYNWYAATDVRGIAPDGFRVPTTNDFTPLVSLTNGSLKSNRLISVDGQPGWNDTYNGTNTTDFSALPSGFRDTNGGSYAFFGQAVWFWATNVDAGGIRQSFRMFQNNAPAIGSNSAGQNGFSIRCVSDTEPSTTLVQDNDGNNYSWVQIGSQYWLKQSLKTTTYNNGDTIATGLDSAAWDTTTDGAYALPNGDSNLPI